MYRANPMKSKLKAGQSVVGCWLQTTSSDVAEILGRAGFDFLLIDHEHGQATIPQAIDQLRAMKGTDTASLMRVPWNDLAYIKRALDAGVEGIMVPMIENAEQARAAVGACLYPPRGMRGAAGTARGSGYGYDGAAYWKGIDDNVLVVLQIESATASKNIPEIAAVQGVDVLFIGPRDLSGSIGKLGQFNDPEVKDLLKRTEERALASGRWVATVAGSAAEAKALIDRGYRIVVPASEVSFLKAGAAEMLKAVRG